MLSFTQSLQDAWTRDNVRAYWLLKLYYGDESSFTGISDIPRERSSDKYYGVALPFKSFNQRGAIDGFTVGSSTMSVTIANTINSVEGKRFSDLYDDQEYANRKWELIQCDENADYSATNIIGSGVISDRTPRHDELTCTIYLDDWWVKRDIELPYRRVTKALYPNAPERNIDKPIPIWIGDYQTDDGISAFNTYEYQKNKVPAIITKEWNDNETGFTLHPDIETVKEVTNVFFYNNRWIVTNDSPTVNNPDVIVKGTVCKAFYSLTAHEDEVTVGTCPDYDEAFDMVGDTDAVWNIQGVSGPGGYIAFSIPDIVLQSLGKNISVIKIKLWGLLQGTVTDPIFMFLSWEGGDSEVQVITISSGLNEYDITSMFSSSELADWTFQKDVLTIQVSNVEDMIMAINEIGIEITFVNDKSYIKRYYQEVEIDDRDPLLIGQGYGAGGLRMATTIKRALGDIEAVYVTGEGRKYGSWIDADSRDNGYNQNALLENPAYIIEDILRNEGIPRGINTVGLTSNEIDYASFDSAGDTDSGDLLSTFNENFTSDIKFAFSQYKFISAKNLIRKICALSGMYFWWSAGKAKIRARKRSYVSGDIDGTIDFNDFAYPSEQNRSIPLPKAFWTPLGDVINKVTVKYAYDYGANQTIKSRTIDDNANLENAASQTKYGQTKEGTLDFSFTLDQTTADNYGEAQISFLKDRKKGVKFQTTTPKYNKHEFGDIVKVTNWASTFKLWGETITSAMPFMITSIEKMPSYCTIEMIRVPGSV